MLHMRDQLIAAVKAHAQGEIAKHKVNVNVYLEHPVGIGEHADLVSAMDEQIDNMAHAEDKLEVLNRYYGNHPDTWMKD